MEGVSCSIPASEMADVGRASKPAFSVVPGNDSASIAPKMTELYGRFTVIAVVVPAPIFYE
jgi:hypothetical protein